MSLRGNSNTLACHFHGPFKSHWWRQAGPRMHNVWHLHRGPHNQMGNQHSLYRVTNDGGLLVPSHNFMLLICGGNAWGLWHIKASYLESLRADAEQENVKFIGSACALRMLKGATGACFPLLNIHFFGISRGCIMLCNKHC